MAFLILQPPLPAFLSTPDTAPRVRLFDMQAELCHSLVQTQQQSLLDEPGSHQHFFQVRFCSRTFEHFSETFFFSNLHFISLKSISRNQIFNGVYSNAYHHRLCDFKFPRSPCNTGWFYVAPVSCGDDAVWSFVVSIISCLYSARI